MHACQASMPHLRLFQLSHAIPQLIIHATCHAPLDMQGWGVLPGPARDITCMATGMCAWMRAHMQLPTTLQRQQQQQHNNNNNNNNNSSSSSNIIITNQNIMKRIYGLIAAAVTATTAGLEIFGRSCSRKACEEMWGRETRGGDSVLRGALG